MHAHLNPCRNSSTQNFIAIISNMFMVTEEDKGTLANVTAFVTALLSILEHLEPAAAALGMHMWQYILKLSLKSARSLVEDLKNLRSTLEVRDKELSLIPVASSTPFDSHVRSCDIPATMFGGESGQEAEDEDSRSSKASKPGARRT